MFSTTESVPAGVENCVLNHVSGVDTPAPSACVHVTADVPSDVKTASCSPMRKGRWNHSDVTLRPSMNTEPTMPLRSVLGPGSTRQSRPRLPETMDSVCGPSNPSGSMNV